MAVGLQLAGKNDFVRVQEDINDNLTKLDEAIDFNLLATLGIEYGGILNNTNAKMSGKAYYDTTGKKLYKCTANTSINYADAEFFEAISNDDIWVDYKNLKFNKMNDNLFVDEPVTTVDNYFKKLPPKYSGCLYFGDSKFTDLPIGCSANSFFFFQKSGKSGYVLVFGNSLVAKVFIGTKFSDADTLAWHGF